MQVYQNSQLWQHVHQHSNPKSFGCQPWRAERGQHYLGIHKAVAVHELGMPSRSRLRPLTPLQSSLRSPRLPELRLTCTKLHNVPTPPIRCMLPFIAAVPAGGRWCDELDMYIPSAGGGHVCAAMCKLGGTASSAAGAGVVSAGAHGTSTAGLHACGLAGGRALGSGELI